MMLCYINNGMGYISFVGCHLVRHKYFSFLSTQDYRIPLLLNVVGITDFNPPPPRAGLFLFYSLMMVRKNTIFVTE